MFGATCVGVYHVRYTWVAYWNVSWSDGGGIRQQACAAWQLFLKAAATARVLGDISGWHYAARVEAACGAEECNPVRP